MDKQFIFNEIERHLLEDEKPSFYLDELMSKSVMDEYPFSMLKDLVKTEQSTVHHPEGNVWKHTLLVVDGASKQKEKSSDKKVFMWAALLHDLGKAPTTKIRKGKITSYDHDKVGEELSVKFLNEFTKDEEFIKKVSKLIRWHMQPLFVINKLPFADIKTMIKEVNTDELTLLSSCDRLGRGGMDEEKIKKEMNNSEKFKEAIEEVKSGQ